MRVAALAAGMSINKYSNLILHVDVPPPKPRRAIADESRHLNGNVQHDHRQRAPVPVRPHDLHRLGSTRTGTVSRRWSEDGEQVIPADDEHPCDAQEEGVEGPAGAPHGHVHDRLVEHPGHEEGR